MTKLTRSRATCLAVQAGYTTIELMVVVALLGVVTGMAVVQVDSARPGLKSDGGMRVVLSQMGQAREMAITQRRNMRIAFTLGNKVTITREEVPSLPNPLTEVQTVLMEGGVQFLKVVSDDTPETFGNSTAVAFRGAAEIKFTPDGTLVDENGATLNGTVLLAIPNLPLSARAVTVFGSTGRIRAYRWNGAAWKPV
jgi:prepilin-type N-terminal cleavage/methylation domain-containing protein